VPWFTEAFERDFKQLLRKVAVKLCESFKLYLWNFFLNNSTNPFRHSGMGTKNFLIVFDALSKRNWEIKKHQLLETSIGRFHSRGQHPCKFIRTEGSSSCSGIVRVRVVLKELLLVTDVTDGSVDIRKEFNSLRIGLVHQYGCRDVMRKCSISLSQSFKSSPWDKSFGVTWEWGTKNC